ncbi:MAG TPA: stage II sporulation protein M [Methanobacterium sp.]|nr:stage II sporulation protein M [Methanobacterium sp.]
MKPVLSIFLALIISIPLSLSIFYLSDFGNYPGFTFILITVFILGGGIATWFSTENKIRYSLYYSIIFALIYGFFTLTLISSLILAAIFAGIGGVIAKNEKNNIKNLIKNKFRANYKSFFINLYNRNKRVLIASLTIFFASVLIGGTGLYLSSSFNHFITNLMVHYLSAIEDKGLGVGTTLSIFLNNSTAALYMYFGGILLGITSIIELVYVGLIVGFTVVKYPFSIVYLLPHSIFELSSYIIAGAAGFKLLSTILNIIWDGLHIKRNNPLSEQVNRILSVNYLKFRDSLTLIAIAVVLLFIAAIIEANISMVFGNYITGLNIHHFASYLLNLINH